MLGLILIIFIGKYFSQLANEYEKNKWLFAIIGVLTYYAGTFIGGLLIGIGYELFSINGIDGIDGLSELFLSIIALPFGIASCVSLYYMLKKNWKKNIVSKKDTIEEIGKI